MDEESLRRDGRAEPPRVPERGGPQGRRLLEHDGLLEKPRARSGVGTVRRVPDLETRDLGLEADRRPVPAGRRIGLDRDVIGASGRVHIGGLVAGQEPLEPGGEIVPVPGALRRPDDLGQGGQPRQGHVFGVLAVPDVFGPEIGLAAEDMRRFGRGQGIGHGLERIDLPERHEASDRERLLRRISLIIIDIAM